MAQKSPNSIDVVDIQFKLHSKTKIVKIKDAITNSSNLLAVSCAQGLLFAGDPEKPEFKIFMTKNVIENEGDDSNILVRSVPLPGTPTILACSCDGGFLAVNYVQNGSSFLQIFSAASLVSANITSLYKIPLSADGNAVCQKILWNPVIAANLAVILKSGGLSMYTLKDAGQYEMHNLDKSYQVQSGCWSPKGKQIVLGFANGKLQQFKPELTAVKSIVCPPGVHSGPFSTIAVHWLSTFQFAVAFLQNGDDNLPSLYIVNAPKGGTPTYINYYDVCYTTGQRAHQIIFTHIQQWNLLLVTSSNGIEVGLLGCQDSSGDTPTWTQYTLLDEARIEMPLTPEKDETFPIGFVLDTSCSHRLNINDNQLPVMPMIHVISTNGVLLSFNFLNLRAGANDICSPPPPLSYSAQHFQTLSEVLKLLTESAPNITPSVDMAAAPAAVSATQPSLIASTPLAKEKAMPFFGGLPGAPSQQPFDQMSNFSNTSKATPSLTASVKPTVPSGFGGGFNASNNDGGILPFKGFGAQQQNTSQASLQSKSQFQPQIHQQQQQQQPQKQQQKTPQQQASSVVSGVKSSELNKPLYTVPPNFTPPTSTTTDTQAKASQQKLQSNASISNKMQTGFLELIAVQINSFDKEIKQSGVHSKGLLKNVGNLDELRACTQRLNDLHELIEQANDHEFEMDLQNLRHSLNEARFMVSECRWKLDKQKNPDLPRLGNSTSDAANRRQLAKLQSYVTTNESQMQLLKNLIDVQWSNFQDTVRRNTKSQIHIPCLDGIYQRMTKMQETLVRQRTKLNRIKSKLQQNGLLHKVINTNSSIVNGKHEVTMESLADSILSMTLAQVVDENRAKLSNEKLNAIREFTRQRKTVNIIKPHRPNRGALRSEVVLETMLQSERTKMREALNAHRAVEQTQELQKMVQEPFLQKPTATKPQMPLISTNTSGAPVSLSFGHSTPTFKTTQVGNMHIGKIQDSKTNNQTQQWLQQQQLQQQQKPQMTVSFTMPTASSGFGLPTTNATTTSFGFSPPDDHPSIPQSPISFAAKVIGGSSATNKSDNVVKVTAPITADKEIKKVEEAANTQFSFAPTSGVSSILKLEETANKPFSFTPTSGAPSIFGVGTAGSAANISPKPQILDSKVFGATLNFAGISSSKADTLNKIVTTTATTATTKPIITGVFSGFGKPVGTENSSAATPLNFSQTSKPSSVIKAPSETATTTTSLASTPVTTATETTASADPIDSILRETTICKPTTKPADAAEPASNLFSGFGAVSSSFSFAPVSGNSSFSFADLSKSITASVPKTTPSEAPTSTTKEILNTAKEPTTITTALDVKSNELNLGLDALGTKVSTVATASVKTTTTASESAPKATITIAPTTGATTTTTMPTGLFAAVSKNSSVAASTTSTSVFASIGLTSATTTAATAISSSAAQPVPANAGIFSSVAALPVSTTTNTSVNSGGSLFGSVPPAAAAATNLSSTFGGFGIGTAATPATSATTTTTGSIFANVAANAPTGGSIFGGMPKPEQSVFSSAATAGPQAPSTGIFATAAQNASPFGTATSSPPPNQSVGGGSIFGGSFSFAKPAGNTGSIFGGSGAPPAPATNTGGSIFGKPSEGGIFSTGTSQQTASPAAGGSIFGQNVFGSSTAATTTSGGLFASAAQSEPSTFGGGASLFAGAATNTSGSGGPLFGAAAPAAASFGSPSGTTGSAGFGAFSQQNTGSPFSSPNSANTGVFGQAAAPVAQSGFGSPQQTSAFTKPTFGGPATFGSPPAFGAQPTFGGGATFGAQKSSFGSFAAAGAASPTTGVFGAPTQQNSLFETLGSSDTGLSFGNLAQGASGNAPKPAFGGSSFTSYRS